MVAAGISLSMYEYKKSISKLVRDDIRAEIKQISPLLSTFNAYFDLANEAHQYGARDDIIKSALSNLRDLSIGKLTLRDENEYYNWLTKRLSASSTYKLRSVKAISNRPLNVYAQDRREQKFVTEINDAISRNVTFTRIFLISKEELLHHKARQILKSQYDRFTTATNQNAVKIVWLDGGSIPHIGELNGGGLSIYDDSEIFFDCSYFPNTSQNTRTASNHSGGAALRPPQAVATVWFGQNQNKEKFLNVYHDVESACDGDIKNYEDLCKSLKSWTDDLVLTNKEKHSEEIQILETELSSFTAQVEPAKTA